MNSMQQMYGTMELPLGRPGMRGPFMPQGRDAFQRTDMRRMEPMAPPPMSGSGGGASGFDFSRLFANGGGFSPGPWGDGGSPMFGAGGLAGMAGGPDPRLSFARPRGLSMMFGRGSRF